MASTRKSTRIRRTNKKLKLAKERAKKSRARTRKLGRQGVTAR